MTIKILGIETSTDACSAALLVDKTVLDRFELAPRRHGQLILSMVESLLDEAGLTLKEVDALAFGRGPGAFTGVRVAACVVQGLAFGVGCPVLPVSTLRALAQRAWFEMGAERVLAGFDARMDEVYWGVYQLDGEQMMQVVHEDRLCSPDAVEEPQGIDWVGVGDAWSRYPDILRRICGGALRETVPAYYPRASEVVRLAEQDFMSQQVISAEQAIPAYLRDSVTRRRMQNQTDISL